MLARGASGLLVVLVFPGNFVFGHFACDHFGLIGIGRAFDGVHELGFETLSFCSEFLDAFRIGGRCVGKIFDIARLASGSWTNAGPRWSCNFHAADARPGA